MRLVKTRDFILREKKRYEVLIADSNIFVIGEMHGGCTDYEHPEIYSNNSLIMSLDDLGFKHATAFQYHG